jgi:broad specificity phosphatase PhoE
LIQTSRELNPGFETLSTPIRLVPEGEEHDCAIETNSCGARRFSWRGVCRRNANVRADPLNFDNVAAQRNLNDKGKALAREFGEALRRASVPVGKIYTSKYNRAYETAALAGFKDIEKTADLTEGGLIVSPNENNRRAEALRKMLAAAPQPGANTVLITHYPNIIAALGKDWFDVKEGEASIFRPQDGACVLVARVQMGEWPRIADTVK